MKPCIFLDIDGVINPSRKKNSYCLDYNLPDVLAKKIEPPKNCHTKRIFSQSSLLLFFKRKYSTFEATH